MHVQVAVVLSEKIDTTVSKGVLRVTGTAIGGSLGECHRYLLYCMYTIAALTGLLSLSFPSHKHGYGFFTFVCDLSRQGRR